MVLGEMINIGFDALAEELSGSVSVALHEPIFPEVVIGFT
jgi:hypothetical protein